MQHMPTTLIFETHATSLDNEAGLASGWYDVDLSERGTREAHQLGERYAGTAIDVVFTSDLWRAWRTAEIAFGQRVPVVRDFRLRECDYGKWTRRPSAEVEAQLATHLVTPFPGGESYGDVVARVRACLEEVLAENAGRTIVVVGHRATWFAFEHLLRRRPLAEVVGAPWQWQPGWRYDAPSLDRP